MGNLRGTFTRAAALLGAAALAVGSAGCSGSTDANPASSTTTAGLATSTTSGAPTSAVGSNAFDVIANMPVEAHQHTNAGAQAFARYFNEAFNRLYMRPTQGQLSSLFTTECTKCQRLEDEIAGLLSRGERVDKTYYETRTVSEPEGDAASAGPVKITALIASLPAKVVDMNGNPRRTLPSGSQELVSFTLRWQSSQWRVISITDQPFTPVAS